MVPALNVCHASGSIEELGVSGSRTRWQGGHFSKLWLKSASLYFGNVCANPVGCSATLHCFACLAKLKSVKQVKIFFFFSYSGLPPFWVTAADLAHVHHLLKQNLSVDSSADVAHWQRTFDESLQQNDIDTKAFLIKEDNLRQGELHPPLILGIQIISNNVAQINFK